jgi:hypothetical protein
MLFMVIETFGHNPKAVYRRFRDEGPADAGRARVCGQLGDRRLFLAASGSCSVMT